LLHEQAAGIGLDDLRHPSRVRNPQVFSQSRPNLAVSPSVVCLPQITRSYPAMAFFPLYS
jgi:hypothetical protein